MDSDSVIYRGRRGRLVEMARLWGRYLTGSVLDVGCGAARHLAGLLVPGDYLGVDIAGDSDLRVDLEEPLPFETGSFDSVVCMDALEHVDRLHAAFDELCRVSRRYVIIGLPNELEWWSRIQIAMGGRFSANYGLPVDPPRDRHRWIFTLAQARAFVWERAGRRGWRVVREAYAYRGWRRALPLMVAVVGCWLAPRGAGLLAKAYWCVLERDG